MNMLPLCDVETLEGDLGEALRARPSAKLNIVRMMANAPSTVLAQLQLGGAINSAQDLAPLRREFLVLLTARLDGGTYVWRQHVAIAERLGATSKQIEALEVGALDSNAFGESDRALLAFGDQVVRGGQIEERTFSAATAHYTVAELVEAILAIGYYMTMNRLTSATGTPLEA